MKLFTKKTLAILLSALIVMSSISIAVMAEDEGTITTQTTFYNGEETGEKVYAKPGDVVKAVVAITSTFRVGSMAFEYKYDSTMFEPDFTKSAALTQGQGYALIAEEGSNMSGYYTVGPDGDGTLYFAITDFGVKQYNNTPAFDVYFKVKSDVPLTEEGDMIIMPDSVKNGDDERLPTEADFITGTTAEVPDGTHPDIDAAYYLPATDYILKVNSTSNVVVVKGSVIYNPNGGTIDGAADPVTVDGYYGAAITENEKKPADITPTAPSGSEFKGWSTEVPPATGEDTRTPLTDDELAAITNGKAGEEPTLYAIYELLPVTLTFDSQGGSNVEAIEEKPGTAITAPADPTKEGYDFGGWYNTADCNDGDVADLTVMPNESKTVYAKWTPKKFHIIYDENGGSEVEDAEVEFDTALPDDPSTLRTGYTFDKWIYSETEGGAEIAKPEKMPAKDLYAKAQWSREVSITLDDEDATTTDDPVIKAKDNEDTYIDENGDPITVDPQNPTKLGDDFDPENHKDDNGEDTDEFEGWKIVAPDSPNNGKLYDFTKTPRENLGLPEGSDIPDFTLTPSFLPYHTVTYKDTDGNTVRTDKVLEGSALPEQPADPEIPEGKVFKGWLDADGKKPTDYDKMPANDLEFTATLADKEPDTYKAIFKDGDKTIEEKEVKEGDPIPLPSEPKKFGFVFKGWEPEVPSAMPANDIEFQAQWEIDKGLIAVVVGGTLVAGGVATAIAATNTALIAGGAVVGGIAVAAIASKTHKVTYLVDGSTYRIFYIVEGTRIIVPKDPSKSGYTFKGWSPEVPERMPDHDLTFEAQFAGSADIIDDVPATGSATAGLAVFAVISGACAAAYVMNKKKKEF